MSLPGNTERRPLYDRIHPLAHDDFGYAMTSWREAHKESSAALLRMPWPAYKSLVGKQLAELLYADSTKTLAAYAPNGKVIGWIAYTPGRTVSAVHWCHTRYELGEDKCRRQGVMTALIDAASLGRRFVYTHKGPRPHVHRGGRHETRRTGPARGPSIDETIAEWLRGRGVTAAFVPFEEYAR